jgi:hypothetical protein
MMTEESVEVGANKKLKMANGKHEEMFGRFKQARIARQLVPEVDDEDFEDGFNVILPDLEMMYLNRNPITVVRNSFFASSFPIACAYLYRFTPLSLEGCTASERIFKNLMLYTQAANKPFLSVKERLGFLESKTRLDGLSAHNPIVNRVLVKLRRLLTVYGVVRSSFGKYNEHVRDDILEFHDEYCYRGEEFKISHVNIPPSELNDAMDIMVKTLCGLPLHKYKKNSRTTNERNGFEIGGDSYLELKVLLDEYNYIASGSKFRVYMGNKLLML